MYTRNESSIAIFSALSLAAISEPLIMYSLTLVLPLYFILARDLTKFCTSALSEILNFSAMELKNSLANSESGILPFTFSRMLFLIMINAILLCLYHFSYLSLASLLELSVNAAGGSSFNSWS
ncbi:hypothetical protein RchiOBHm_Chr2g0111571 [Rosa chinensis]|uniref:Uncharacterized protein n=1 Tax=Rosa chinensis TaxID=74649 RepID=A0A2P6RPZ4_ROSCH|nr:hypothetical protein RchiOBHm_Chr2g0111571 [Rosa chinensis]